MLTFLLLFALVGGGAYTAYHYSQKDADKPAKVVKKTAKKAPKEKKEKRSASTKKAKPAVAAAAAEEPATPSIKEPEEITIAQPKRVEPKKLGPMTSYDRAPKAVSHLPKSIEKILEKNDYAATREATLEWLKKEGKLDPSNNKHLHAAMLAEFIRVTDAAQMSEWADKDKKKAEFLQDFCKDSGWLELYLGSGRVPQQNTVCLDILYRIHKLEKGKVANKAIAVALASHWGASITNEPGPNKRVTVLNPNRFTPEHRYEFFQKQEKAGKLHPNYPKLRPWELHFVVGIAAQDWDDLSFDWAAENINLPWDQYQSACWAATYTDPSRFGDSVQGGAYNMPYSSMSTAETTQRNGGVCGALSHLGTFAAMAHGIPSYTVGQPGHCAYAVRPERGSWVGGFGGPDGGMHTHIFGNRAPESYLLMESVFGDDEGVARGYRESYIARALEDMGEKEKAKEAWKRSLTHSPLHQFFRKELHRLMIDDGITPNDCYEYLMEAIPHYVHNGFSAVNMSRDLDSVIEGMSDKQKCDIYAAMHNVIADTLASWATKCSDIIEQQVASVSDAKAQENLLAQIFATHMNSGDGTIFGQVLEWAVATYAGKPTETMFSDAFAKAAAMGSSSGSADEGKAKRMAAAYNKAIFAAEQARSASAFQSLSQAARKQGAQPTAPVKLTRLAEINGKPAKAALVRLSTTSNYDAPACHIDIPTLNGGRCHTAKENKPNIIIELPSRQSLAGCIIRKTNGNEGRMKKATVSISSDGATWVPQESIDSMPKEWVVPFPGGTAAKWVKVEFDNPSPDFAHISHFVIFTR